MDAFVKAVAGETQGPGGPPPFDFANTDGVAVVDGGLSQVTDIELKEGKYAFVCFLTDRAGGKPHLGLGMVEEVTISG